MTESNKPDSARRSLLRAVLAGGAVYALPAVATLAPAVPARAQPATGSSSEPGAQGQGPANRPAAPGAGGRGVDTGLNPGQGHDNGPATGSGEETAGARIDEIGPGGRGFA